MLENVALSKDYALHGKQKIVNSLIEELCLENCQKVEWFYYDPQPGEKILLDPLFGACRIYIKKDQEEHKD